MFAQYVLQDVSEVKHQRNWISQIQAFQTSNIAPKENRPQSTCYADKMWFGKWLHFKSTTKAVELRLKYGGQYGTLRHPRITLYNSNFEEVKCEKYDAYTVDLLLYSEIESGKDYYVFVSPPNFEEDGGTFTLGVSNEFHYDYASGAYQIPSTNHYCTEDKRLSTSGATSQGVGSTCSEGSPNFNRWFQFKAASSKLEVKVYPTGLEGDFQWPYLTIFDENFKQVKCQAPTDVVGGVDQIYVDDLEVSKTYYLSVDHNYNEKYKGSFQLCFHDFVEQANYELHGLITDQTGKVVSGAKLEIQDKGASQVLLADQKGRVKFKLDRLPKQNEFVAMLEQANHHVDLIVVDEDKRVVGVGKKEPLGKQVRLVKRDQNCGTLLLFNCDEQQNVQIEKGKKGVLGKVVQDKDRLSGVGGVQFDLYDHKFNKVGQVNSDDRGFFEFKNLDPDRLFLVKMQAKDQELYTEILELDDQKKPTKTSTSEGLDENGFFHFKKLPRDNQKLIDVQAIDHSMPLLFALEEQTPIQLKNVYFKKASAELLETSIPQLNLLAKELKSNQGISIDILGHTDNVGDVNFNLALSQQRAKQVASQLIALGIDASRVNAIGLGSTKPLGDNKTDQGRKANRRVEFQISKKE